MRMLWPRKRSAGFSPEESRLNEAVQLSEAALERGEHLTHDHVGERIDRLFQR